MTRIKVAREKIYLPANNLTLEGYLETPASDKPMPGVVMCHPHPLYGGNMDNYTLRVIKRELNQRGIVTLRFNFRGVGNSEGTYDEGIGEQKDTLAALAFLSQCQKVERGRIALIGYSFGGMVALSTCKRNPLVKSIAAISPVVTPGLLQGNDKPTLLICGDKDEMTPPANIIDNPEKNFDNFFVKIIKGADHFWMGYEKELSDNVFSFLERHL